MRYRHHCLQKTGVTESFPFDENTLVYKVGNKMFTLAQLQPFVRINVKCDPEQTQALREQYVGIVPGWHMNKKHWNSLMLQEDLTDRLILQCIDESYKLVMEALPAKVRSTLHVV